MIDHPVGRAAGEAMPWAGLSPMPDHDQVESARARSLDDPLGRVPRHGLAVQLDALFFRELPRPWMRPK